MKHLKAIGIKFIIMATILLSFLGIFETTSVAEIIVMSAILTLAAYVIGDLWILPKMGHLAAAIGDLIFGYASVWVLLYLFIGNTIPISTASIYIAITIGISEAVFHIYMKERIIEDDPGTPIMHNVQTEYAEEQFIDEQDIDSKSKTKHQQDE